MKQITFKSKSELSRCMGINRNTVIAWAGRADFPGGDNGPWKLAEIVPWILARQKQRDIADDPALDGAADSPGLERYRQAKAELAEIEVASKRDILVPIDKLKPVMLRWATIIRRCGEWLGKRWGNEAAEALNDALAECQRVVDDEFGTAELANGPDERVADVDPGRSEGADCPDDGTVD